MKISFSFFTFLLYILLIFSGYINYLIIFLFIMITHELGHIMMIKILKYQINSITILPTGGIINTNITLNIKSNHLFLISISGILMQLLLFLLIPYSSNYNYTIFYKLNLSLIIFNLLPINPLDGYKILISIIERFIKYRLVIKLSYIISFIFIILSFIYTKNIFIFIFLYMLNIKEIINYHYVYNKFLLERYLYHYVYRNEVYVKSLKDIYKNKNNYIKENNRYIREYLILEKHFNKLT